MTSLPIVATNPPRAEALGIENSSEQFLLQAFRSFADTAEVLERSYGKLRSEVEQLHGELAQSHAGLARSLEENREMRQHLDRIVEGLPCGVLVTRSDGAISLINPEANRLLRSIAGLPQTTAETSSGIDINDTDRLASVTGVPAELHKLLKRAQREAGEHEYCFQDLEGNDWWLAARHASVRDGKARDGQSQAEAVSQASDEVSIFILRDVSDAKRLVWEREKSRREQALAEMSAILAHEIRNPLGSLELFAGLLAEAELTGECHHWVEQVQAGLRTLAATVNNVLHFHNLPAPQRVPMDMGRLLDWAGAFLLPMARQARVELSVRNRLHDVWYPADRHRIEQVLLNLVLNAFRAMPGGGCVEIAGRKIQSHDGDAVSICVSDTGPGIQAEEVSRIFEPGFSTRAGSPGLGLTVCRKIVEQHGGSMVAANRPHTGASFTIALPLYERKVMTEVAG